MILVSDASVLIDIGYVDALPVLSAIAPVEALDVVLLECEDPRQPGLLDAIRDAGIQEVGVEAEWVAEAVALRKGDLSLADALGFYYAKQRGRTLLATDRPLRERCVSEGVEVHGTLWIAQQALAQSLVDPEDICEWLRVWDRVDSRLPNGEVRALKAQLGCA